MSERELTDEEISKIELGIPIDAVIIKGELPRPDSKHRAIADAQLEKVLRVLSAQCGDDPCKGCPLFGNKCKPQESYDFCEPARYFQAGLAKGLQDYEALKEAHFQLEIQHSELARDYDANLRDLKACEVRLQERGKHETDRE